MEHHSLGGGVRRLTSKIVLCLGFAVAALLSSAPASAQIQPDPDQATLFVEAYANGLSPAPGSSLTFTVSSSCLASDSTIQISQSSASDPNLGGFSIRIFDEVFDAAGALCDYTITAEPLPGIDIYPPSIDFQFGNGPYAEATAVFTFVGAPTGSLEIGMQAWDVTLDQYESGSWPPSTTWTFDSFPDAWVYTVSSPCLAADRVVEVPALVTNPVFATFTEVTDLPLFGPTGNPCLYDVTPILPSGFVVARGSGTSESLFPRLVGGAGFLIVRTSDAPPPTATPPTPTPPASTPTPSPVEYCLDTTIPVIDGQPNGGCPVGIEYCVGSTIPVVDGQPNGGCPVAPEPTASPTTIATPISGPTATATPVPEPTLTPTPTATSAPIDMPVSQLLLAAGGLGLEDPYICGGGFFGSVAGGSAPYTLTYAIAGSMGDFDLGSFVVDAPGPYTSPSGFIDYGVVPDGMYQVSIEVSDASVPPQVATRPNLFEAMITDLCALPTAPLPSKHVAAAAGPAATTGHIAVAAPSAGSFQSKAASIESPAALALTGTNTNAVDRALWAIALGTLMVAASKIRSRRSS